MKIDLARFVLYIITALVCASITFGSSEKRRPTAPNIIRICTDDQAMDSFAPTAIIQAGSSAGQPVMHYTRQLIGQQGTTFANAYVSVGLCSPSRATLLTGQYAHNHGVLTNQPPNGGYAALDHTNTLFLWLQNAGYHTVHMGKYVNNYNMIDVPQGYDEWYTSEGYNYFNYDLNENGSIVHYGSSASEYYTDVMRDKAIAFIGQAHDTLQPIGQPFFLQVDFIAPHDNESLLTAVTPAPRHVGLMSGYTSPSVGFPSFNELDVSDKPALIQALPLLSQSDINFINKHARQRMESLLSVDEALRDIVRALANTGQLDNTYFIFTSDNGFHYGEHRIVAGKNEVYEESVHIPLLIRGPGALVQTRREIVCNVDMPATILGWSGAIAGLPQDGLSLAPLLDGSATSWRTNILLERFNPNRHFEALRNTDWLYCEHETNNDGVVDAVELYQFTDDDGNGGTCGGFADPFEMQSVHGDPCYAGVMRQLKRDLDALKTCSGMECR